MNGDSIYHDEYYDHILDECSLFITPEKKIVFNLISDMTDRRGLRQEFEGFYTEEQDKLISAWLLIVKCNKDPNKIIDMIIVDINDRSGLGEQYQMIDSDIQQELRTTWIEIIKTK
jgi:hypothetical protein